MEIGGVFIQGRNSGHAIITFAYTKEEKSFTNPTKNYRLNIKNRLDFKQRRKFMDKRVFIAGCQDYHRKNVEISIQRALKVLGGVQAMDLRGKKVLIKANLLSANKADRAVTTHPEVVGVLARIFMEGGAEVTIADSPAG